MLEAFHGLHSYEDEKLDMIQVGEALCRRDGDTIHQTRSQEVRSCLRWSLFLNVLG